MSENEDAVTTLIEDAATTESLRLRFSQDRTAEEFVESAAKEGYSISKRDARKILAGAFLTSDSVGEGLRNKLVGGLSWNYLEKVEEALNGDFSLLNDPDAWKRAEEFYLHVFDDEPE